MSSQMQQTDDDGTDSRRSTSSDDAADISTDEAPPSLPSMDRVSLGELGGRELADGQRDVGEISTGMERSQSKQSRSLQERAAREETIPSQPNGHAPQETAASPIQSSIPEPRQPQISSSPHAMSPLPQDGPRRPTSGIFARAASAASARSTSSSSSLVKERVQSIEALDKRRASLDLVRRVSAGSSSRVSQRRTPLARPLEETAAAPSTRSPAKRWSALQPREPKQDVIASPSRSSATTVRRADEDETITLPNTTMLNGFRTPGSASARTGSHDETSSWHPNDNDLPESEMDAEEKVDMWRLSGRMQTERDSGGSASSGKRRSALPREFRGNTADPYTAASPSGPNDIETPTRSLRPDVAERLESNTLTRSISLRSSGLPQEIRLRRSGKIGDSPDHHRLASLRLSAASVSGLRREAPSAAESDRWETGSTRTRHSSLMPPSRPRDDISGVLSAVEAEREESKARRLALLHSLETTPDKSTMATPRRSMDTMHRSHLSESRIRPSTSFSLRTAREGDAPSFAPAMAPSERRVYTSLRISQGSSNAPESPLRHMRSSTRMSHRATASEASPRLDRTALHPPAGSETSISSSGTPSRVVMARLLASMRGASSHEARLLVEACMTLVERSAAANMHPAGLFESAHKTVAAVDLVAARLQGALHAVQTELEEVESASPEEAQAIVMAGHQRLVTMLRDVERDQQDTIRQLTMLLEAATKAVVTGGQSSTDARQSPFKLREEPGAMQCPVNHRLETVRTRLHDRPMSPYRNHSSTSISGQSAHEVRRMSSEIMRPSTSLDTLSPRNRFSTQTRHAARSPVSSRTSGEYFTAAEGSRSDSRRSPFRASTVDGLPDSSTIYETPDEGVPAVRRSSSIFRRFQRSPLKTATVAVFPGPDQTPPAPAPAPAEPRSSSSYGNANGSGTRPRPVSGTSSRGGPFMPAMPQRTPTTAISTINATTEVSPVQPDFFEGRNSGESGAEREDAASRFRRAGTEESNESYRTAQEEEAPGGQAGAGAPVARRGSMGALRKMSSFITGGREK